MSNISKYNMTDVVIPIHREASTIPFRLVRLVSIWKVVDYLKNVEMTPESITFGITWRSRKWKCAFSS